MANRKKKIQNSQNGGGKPNVGRTPFQNLCRSLFALIKILHHHTILANSKKEGLPKAFKQKVDELGKFLKPARPNPNLARELDTLAKGWGSQVRDRLPDHYQDEILKIEASIQDPKEIDSDAFETATQVALNWSKSRMKKKLTSETKLTFLKRIAKFRPQANQTDQGTPRQPGQKSKRDLQSPEVTSPGTIPAGKKVSGYSKTQTFVAPTPGKRGRANLSPNQDSPSPSQASKHQKTEIPDQGASPDLSWRTVGRRKSPVKLGTFDKSPEPKAPSPSKTRQTPEPKSPSLSETRQTYVQAASSPPKTTTVQSTIAPTQTQSYPAKVIKAQPNLTYEEKMTRWNIKPADLSANTLILGTSNVARITTKPRRDIELQSFPGGRFSHMREMLRKLPVQNEPRRVVIAMGINDSNSKTPLETIKKDIRETSVLAKSRFPHSQIYMAEINHSKMMESNLKSRTLALNEEIKNLSGIKFIPKLNCNQISVCPDKIHWTVDTATKVMRHWATHLN